MRNVGTHYTTEYNDTHRLDYLIENEAWVHKVGTLYQVLRHVGEGDHYELGLVAKTPREAIDTLLLAKGVTLDFVLLGNFST